LGTPIEAYHKYAEMFFKSRGYSLGQVARCLHVGTSTIHRWFKQGIPTAKVAEVRNLIREIRLSQ